MRKRTSIVRAKQHVTVPRGHRIHRSASGWDLIDPQGKVAQHFARASALPAEDNPNWVSYSDLTPAPLPAINRFVSVWTVPPLPSDGTILIYFFNGLEESSGQNILQPVLQWGPTPHGTIAGSWSIASWYVGDSTSPAFSSKAIAVAPGTQLTGVMEFDGSSWNCYFRGYDASTLEVDTLPDMQVASLTLEAYANGDAVPTNLTLPGPPVSFQVTGLTTVSGDALATCQWSPYGQWPPTVNAAAAQSGRIATAYSTAGSPQT